MSTSSKELIVFEANCEAQANDHMDLTLEPNNSSTRSKTKQEYTIILQAYEDEKSATIHLKLKDALALGELLIDVDKAYAEHTLRSLIKA